MSDCGNDFGRDMTKMVLAQVAVRLALWQAHRHDGNFRTCRALKDLYLVDGLAAVGALAPCNMNARAAVPVVEWLVSWPAALTDRMRRCDCDSCSNVRETDCVGDVHGLHGPSRMDFGSEWASVQ